jgi:hypothetical protein
VLLAVRQLHELERVAQVRDALVERTGEISGVPA